VALCRGEEKAAAIAHAIFSAFHGVLKDIQKQNLHKN
jgi:hypothetical protein